jgi:hypothetical protein
MANKKIYCIVEQRKYTAADKGIARKEITEFDAKEIATRLLESEILNNSGYDVKYDNIQLDVNSKPQRLSSLGIQKILFDTFKSDKDIPQELAELAKGLNIEHIKAYQRTLGSRAFENYMKGVSKLLYKARVMSKYDLVYHDIFYITDAHFPVDENVFLSSIYSTQHLQEKINNVGRARKSWVITYEADY